MYIVAGLSVRVLKHEILTRLANISHAGQLYISKLTLDDRFQIEVGKSDSNIQLDFAQSRPLYRLSSS